MVNKAVANFFGWLGAAGNWLIPIAGIVNFNTLPPEKINCLMTLTMVLYSSVRAVAPVEFLPSRCTSSTAALSSVVDRSLSCKLAVIRLSCNEHDDPVGTDRPRAHGNCSQSGESCTREDLNLIILLANVCLDPVIVVSCRFEFIIRFRIDCKELSTFPKSTLKKNEAGRWESSWELGAWVKHSTAMTSQEGTSCNG